MESQEKLFEYLKRAAADLQETRKRLRMLEAAEREPVAIVGMGCRFPGGVAGPDDLWQLVASGTDAISGFPDDRGWDVEGLYDPDPSHPEVVHTRKGGFVYRAGDFDAGFFGISPREALAMDPQQRLLLEVCWEALERAGIDPRSLRGSQTGVFAGAAYSEYGAGQPEGGEGFALTGQATSVVSGRVSYTLGLEGPAVTVDTGCSSSLVTLHLACQALRAGECSLALAGGVTVMVTPGAFAEFARQRGLASDGRCKAFSAAADGMGWGEGAGMLVLERLSDAHRHGHRVLAVVAGSAVNQDGASNGLTAPNGPSQQRVIRAALDSARVSADQVDAVEAHGTGTTLGDPIEAQALIATYGQRRPQDQPLWLGSVKSNIGHAQCAAGVAGVIKMVLALQRQMLPATLHAEEPSPNVDWSAGAVRLLTEPVPWLTDGRPRRAGVSSFGVSGTNVHAILEEAPVNVPGAGRGPAAEMVPVLASSEVVPWLVSGRSAESLAAQAGRLRDWMAARPELDVADVAFSLATSRSVFEHRAVVTGVGREELAAGLAAMAAGQPAAGLVTGVAGAAGQTVFVFPGQGGQWAGMGQELAARSPVFAARLAECGRALAPHVGWSLEDVLAGADGAPGLDRVDVVQPALWAVMVSLAAVWAAAGVVPDAVVGHSQGEIAAACVAGILSLEDAAAVVARRSQALSVLAGRGAMVSVAEPAPQVVDRLAAWGGRLSVAAVNGPAATVVSGDPDAMAELAAQCMAAGIRARVLPVDYASHSAQVEQIREEIVSVLAGITPGPARIPMVSAMTGEFLAGPEADAEYWYQSLRAPVEFDRAVRVLAEAGHGTFIESSPHPVLAAAVTATLEDTGPASPPVVTGTLRRDDGGPGRFLASLAEAYVRGAGVDWAAVLGGGERVELPTYPFQRQRYWQRPLARAGRDGAETAAEARFWAAVEGEDAQALAATLAVDDRQRLEQVLPALASWRRRERDRSATAGWRYQVRWVPVPDRASATLSGTWLVVVPATLAGGDLARGCARALATRGAQTAMIETAAEADRGVLADLIGRARADAEDTSAEVSGVSGVSGVVSLLGLAEAPAPGFPVVPQGLAGTVALVQGLGDAGVRAPLWLLTSGAVAAGPDEAPASPVQAQVWGLGRVAGLEHPDRWGGLVDVPPVPDERSWDRVCEVLAGCGEDQVAIRPGGILGRRLVRADARRGPARRWASRGTALVTGGMGVIGPHLVQWLAARGTARVVLVSRSGPGAAGVAGLAAKVAEAGSEAAVIACDITERAGLHELLSWIGASGPALRAVVHAAVWVDLVPVAGTGLAGLAAGLAAKVAGAALLDELTAGLDLDAFVLFSSIAGVWGSSYHGAYAAGNAYLDALAQNRRARGLPATSVAWGIWDAGMDRDLEEVPGAVGAAGLRRQGLRFLNPARALAALGQVLADDETFVAMADVDWARFAPVYGAARSWRLLQELAEVRALAAPAAAGDLGLAARLAGLGAAERDQMVLDLVRGHAAAVLGHASAGEVSPGRAFRDLGFDSLTAVELRDRLNSATGLRLPSTVVFDYPSAVALARLVAGKLLGIAGADLPAVPAAVAAEPVAVVGMGCRYPGGVASPEELWALLAVGGDAVSGFPADRGWDIEELFDPDPDRAGTCYTRAGGFVHEAAGFDAGFFGISPREALAMDPQQRLLLEVCWEAVERAGIDPESLRGSLTGVFAGASSSGYGGVDESEGHLVTGNVSSVISGRVSYTLGLEGPAVTVDTACSSSLVALHLACQALRSGECSLALAGGVAVIVSPAVFVGFSRQRALAADGRCKAFSAAADGMGLAEGAGVVLLERLSDARRNGHPILAVVAGSAVNQDGASNGLTAPNGPSQQRVIRAALASARLSADEVDAVEAHGTGTTLGDPIEAHALIAAYGQGRPEGRPLWLGSVKSNIGHAQAAAGAAGVIKMVLALQHGLLPATLHAAEPSPHVDWSAGSVRLLTEPVPWPAGGGPRRAGVSAFGISGTNAHVIVVEAPAGDRADDAVAPGGGDAGRELAVLASPRLVPWLVSGRTAEALAAQAGRLAGFVASRPELDLADAGWSLATTRPVFEHRAVVAGGNREELAAGLAAVAAGEPAAGVVTGAASAGDPGRTVFVFPGQGGQWAGMGRELAASSPVFAARLADCGRALAPHVDWSLEDVLAGAPGAPDLDRADVVQPALWAVMVSLAALWEAAGVTPDAVAGHSQGEIAAACVAGVLSLEDAAAVVALRSKALVALAGRGGMVSVAEPAAAVRDRLAAWDGGRLSVAAVNGPAATVVSGDPEAVAELASACAAAGVRARVLPVDYASHSIQVEELRDEIVAVLAGISPGPARVPMVSALTGEVLAGPELDAGYWYDSLRAPVEFDRAVRVLAGTGHGVFVEVSPHPVLTAAVTETLEDAEPAAGGPAPVVTGTLRRDDGGPDRFLASLATVHVRGATVEWAAVLGGGERVELPTYAFQHQLYWPRASRTLVPVGGDGAETAAEARFWAAVEGGDARALAATLAVEDDRLEQVLPALACWRRRERDRSVTGAWRYRVTWAPVADRGPVALAGTWLVVVPAAMADGDLADGCVQAMAAGGAEVVIVEVAAGEVDREVLAGLVAQALAAGSTGSTGVTGVLSLLALGEGPVPGFAVVPEGLAGTLGLVQGLGDAEITAPLWVVTCGAVAAGPGEVPGSAEQAQVWGLGRVAALEHPDRWGGLIDVPPVLDERAASRLCAVLAGCGEDQAAVRSSGVWGRRLVRAPLPPDRDGGHTWVPAGTVLVTGGTGGVGGHVARWLAGRAVPRVVLASRSGPQGAGVAGLAAELAEAGTAVGVAACDVAERDQVSGLVAWAGPGLAAVMHAAGTEQPTALAQMTLAELAGVLSAKVAGAVFLDEVTAALELSGFVLFSSGAAAWGSGMQGGYAAANAFLDALAEQRRGRGLAGTSVAWGLWGGGGMGTGQARTELQRRGLRVMDPVLAAGVLGEVLDHGEGLVTVADLDWARFAPAFTVRRPSPLIAGVPEVSQALAAAADGTSGGEPAIPGARTALGLKLAALSRAEQDQMLIALVRAEAAAVLGHHSPAAVEPGRAFKDLGFDSLTAVDLRNRLNAATGLPLPATLAFDYPNAMVLAGHLRAELLGVPAGTPAAPVETATAGDPIAIVAMSCRYPGGAVSPEALWELVTAGTDAISEFPGDRGWDTGGLPDPAYARQGGFVYDAAGFDANFFGISPREALAMDPQQRLLLEVSWEAFERAGIDPASLRGSRTGVFAGAASSGYGAGLDGARSEGYLLTGSATAVISGRVSYTLGLEGPAVTVDTACSSSLVTLHLACQALRSGECSLALAGGVAVMVTPGAYEEFSRQGGLAADGRCKAFSATADGIGWAEGAGMVLLERLSDARRNGHPVLAVVAGSAVNQDGASNGLTAPNGPSQQRVIRAALASAGLSAGEVDAVEAHGTGTMLGDPIEAQALLATYGQDRPEDRPLWLGSVKSNIGHAQAAAGVVGVIKMVLALQHQMLPATLHVSEPSPHVDWSAGAVRLLAEPVPWSAGGHPRRAGVSAFGVSGTNVHAIVAEAPADEDVPVEAAGDGGESVAQRELPVLASSGLLAWLVSGRTAESMAAQAERLAHFVAARPELDPADVGWSLATTRSVFEHRAVVIGADREELAAGLAAVAAGEPAAGVITGAASAAGQAVFVFPGQGGQWAGMGRELAAASPVFAARLAECGRALAPHVDWSLEEVLAGELGLDRVDVVQPVLWAVMVSLAAVWQAAGVTPDAVAGHSQGEIAAACVAGILTLEDAAKVVALRSKALMALAGHGGMASVAEPAAAVRERLEAWAGRLSVAAVNGPAATVVSGDPGAVAELAAACGAAGVRARVLPVDYASHSAQVEEIRQEVLAALDGIAPGPARVPMVSALTGEFLAGPEANAGYWYESLRAPVEFDRAVRVLAGSGHDVFIEVSPHPVLTAAVTETLEGAEEAAGPAGGQTPAVTGTLRRGDGGPARFLASLAAVHVRGVPVDWAAVLGGGERVDLPTYAFQHQWFWPSPVAEAGDVARAGLGVTGHPLLGAAVELAAGEGFLLTGRLSVRSQPWLADHAVAGLVLLPGTALVEMAVRAGQAAGCSRVAELALEAPLVLPAEGGVRVQVVVGGSDEDGQRPVEVYARPAEGETAWTRHASGRLAPAVPADADLSGEFGVWPPPGAAPVDTSGVYTGLAAAGYGYGPVFRGLRAAWRCGGEVFAEVALPEEVTAEAGSFGVHPALLDAALHAAGLAGELGAGPGEVLLPFAWTGVSVFAAGASVLRVRLRLAAGGGLSLVAADGAGVPVVSVGSLVMRPVTAARVAGSGSGLADALFGVEWVPVPVPAAAGGPAGSRWAVVGGDLPGLTVAGVQVGVYAGLGDLVAAVGAGEPVPEVVLACAGGVAGAAGDAAGAARVEVGVVLGLVQEWLGLEPLAAARLVVVTRGAVAAVPGEGVSDLAGAAAWGLVRSAQSENPGRVVLADLPAVGSGDAMAVLTGVLESGEPELAVRDGVAFGRRLARPDAGLLSPPAGEEPWRLDVTERGTLDAVALVPCPEAAAPLEAGQVRVAVRAAGLNFRDVLIGLDMYPGDAVMGSEVAGIVIETGPQVAGLAAGDRVMGIASRGFGPVAVADARLLARIPAGWSFAQAAAVPIAFSTAWYGLVDLAGARPGQRLLVHAAAGGVGMAAVAIGRYLGLEVFGTASPGKWDVLAGLGLDAAHVASSRTPEFEGKFLAATGGAGVDIVLNSLAGELTDASLRLLPRGGAFIEMGKTDVRDPGRVAVDHPGVTYRAFETGEAGPERLGQILAEETGLLAAGKLTRLPVRAWDVRRAREALRFMSQARHAGKIVLTIPPDPAAPRDPGTVLITGGTGTLGALVAGHLAATGRARHVVLASRSGPAAPGVAALAARLAAAGVEVQVTACDTADRAALASLLARGQTATPLTVVVHAAGVLDDGVTEALTPARVDTVMRPKADAAWHLHELTRDADLELFVLFSSASGVFGGAGQGNYAAANAFLDGLAACRRAAGLPAVSLAWGLWADASGLTGHLGGTDRARMERGGVVALSAAEGLGLLDAALARDEALLVPARLDIAGLRARAARGGQVLPLFRGLAGTPACLPAVSAVEPERVEGSLGGRLAVLAGGERDRVLLDLVRGHVAAVLGHGSAAVVEPGRAFGEIGFDSLTAVELRNRLNAATGLRLPATLVFDYPTPVVLAAHLRAELLGDRDGEPPVPVLAAPVVAGEPVAIVAMGCRFPGGVSSPEGLWELLAAGRDAISGFPADRGWDIESLYDPDPDHARTSYVRTGGFVADVAGFDPGFFGISPREALAMDPQQRLLLETCWEAFERAGLDPATLRGSQTGVFVGAAFSGYGAGLPAELEGHLLTGTATSVMSGRVAYTLGLEGPAVTVDTACSSSLVTVHQACQALRAGECTLALAGGVMIMVTPGAFTEFSRQRALAADGRCKAFSAAADGMGLAEGVGMVLLERLSDARRNGHQVLAVIRGSAVNQDGASNGLTAPNGPSQQRVIRAALASAQVSADQVDAVEAHGTGTALGDPIEAQALLATYGQGRPADRPLWLGSVKSNIGHTQAAAGVAGVIKMVLALQHGMLPQTLHAEEPSPHVDWSAGGYGSVRLLTEPVPWPADGHPRRAGVSSFGISGTNAHAILEEAPADDASGEGGGGADGPELPVLAPSGVLPWLVSGRTAEGLAAHAGRLAGFMSSRPELDPADVGWSLVTTRSVLEHRAVVIGAGREELAAGLAAMAAGQPAAGVIAGVASDPGQTVFVFPGQGGQWAGMGRELAAASPVFAARLAECGRALAPHVDWSLEDVLAGTPGAPGLDRADVVQPVLWAVMVALAAVWQAAGVGPDAVAGHSQGEIAAACVAGILSLQDAAAVVALRSQALIRLAGRGGMMSVAEPAAAVRDRLAAWGDRLSVAAVNGPAATVVSGDLDALAELAAQCAAQGVRAKTLPVDYASHGAQVEAIRAEVLAALAGISPGPARVPMVSALTGEFLDGPEAGAGYWYESLRSAVEFDRAVRVLAEAGHRVFIEVSPHPVLAAAVTETLEDVPGAPAPVVTGTLRRDDGGPSRFLASLAAVHVRGAGVDWAAVLGSGRRVDLPTYAFQRQRYWPKSQLVLVPAGGDGAGAAAEARFWAAVEGGDVQGLTAALAVDGQRPFSEVLPALASWRRQEQHQSAVAGWRYRVSWMPVIDPEPVRLSGPWLVVVAAGQASGDLADGCVQALAACGAEVAIVEVNPDEADREVLAARISTVSGVSGVSGVVSLLALAEAPVAGHPVVAAGLAGTLALVQALGDVGIGAPLWLLTCGAVAAEAGEVPASPVQAQVWGLGRVAGLEHPDRWGGLIDVPPVLDGLGWDRVCGALAGCGEDQVAIRGAGMLARRLVRAAPGPGPGRRWVPRGTVLITGGTGVIGPCLARRLAQKGAPRVVLVSRSGPGAAGVAELAADLAAAGTGVSVVACDITERSATCELLGWIGAGGPPLSAVMHVAVNYELVALADTGLAGLAAGLGVKVAGAALLDELTAGMGLDAFVLFSSIAGVWGSSYHGAYAAGNAYLDALAENRRGRGLPATSVAWGIWETGWDRGQGVLPESVSPAGLRRQGMRFLDAARALTALEQALADDETFVAVADVDWERFTPVFQAARSWPLFDELAEVRELATAVPAEAAAALTERLAGTSPAERERVVLELVRAHAAAVLGHPSAEAVPPGRAFREMGFDSLTAVELRDRLSTATGLRLPSTVVFDYPTPAALASHLQAVITQDDTTTPLPVLAELDKLESMLSAVAAEDTESARITTRLEAVISKWKEAREKMAGLAIAEKIESSTDDEVFDFIGKEFGIS